MAADPDAIAQIQDLRLEFPTYHGAVQALSGVTLTMRRGEIVGLVGESGSGKSVTALALLRLLPQGSVRFTGGSVALLGRDILRLPERSLEDIRGNAASMIFQEPMTALNPTIRIGRQIMQVIRRHEDVSEKEAQRRTEALLTEMQIPDAGRVMRNYPFELSGGMRQRVLIAMAFSCNPDVLIADEPTTALDVTVQAQVLSLLRERARARGASVLFITHDLAVVGQLCDRVYVMYAGTVAEEGATADVLSNPLHPYTRALLKSLPEFAAPKSHLVSIRGTVPSLVSPPAGCLFRNRCPYARERCREQPPLLDPAGRRGGHRAACWFLDELPDERAQQAAAHEAEAEGQADGAALLVSLRDVSVHFPVGANWFGRARATVHALSGVDLDIRKSETLGIVGESGCGKSTLAQVIMALQPPTAGTVAFEGIDLATADADTLRRTRRRFQIVFQDPQSSLDPRMAVWRLISEPLHVAGERRKGRLKERAAELAEQVGLRREQLDRYPHEFSGGQRQRIAIARALALNPELVVLDEPTSALDVSVQAQILNLLMDLQRDLRLTYLFISHNIQVVRHISHRIAVMYLGQIVELGTAGDILGRPSHPYTRTLLAAVPRLAGGLAIDAPKAGELPSNTVLPEGCFYRDRCAFAAAGCERPQVLRPLASTSVQNGAIQVRCHRAEAIRQGDARPA
jgi:peptide/nickel transport system ATP-binding protein